MSTKPTLQTFYVSLTRDLLGCYLAFRADSAATVITYLQQEYYRNGVWKLPWCAIYAKLSDMTSLHCVIQAKCGPLYAGDF